MIELRDLYQNQFDKMRVEFDVFKYPHSMFFYSNGVHLLFIKKMRKGYGLCGLGTKFVPLFSQNDFDVYFIHDDLYECVKEFEKFIKLLIFKPEKDNSSPFYSSELV